MEAERVTQLGHVTVELLKQSLEADEHRVQGRLVPSEAPSHKGLEGRSVTVFDTPELAALLQPALKPGALGLAAFGDKVGF
jgi:hypothetical protein